MDPDSNPPPKKPTLWDWMMHLLTVQFTKEELSEVGRQEAMAFLDRQALHQLAMGRCAPKRMDGRIVKVHQRTGRQSMRRAPIGGTDRGWRGPNPVSKLA